jgi:hypothetical protein
MKVIEKKLSLTYNRFEKILYLMLTKSIDHNFVFKISFIYDIVLTGLQKLA